MVESLWALLLALLILICIWPTEKLDAERIKQAYHIGQVY